MALGFFKLTYLRFHTSISVTIANTTVATRKDVISLWERHGPAKGVVESRSSLFKFLAQNRYRCFAVRVKESLVRATYEESYARLLNFFSSQWTSERTMALMILPNQRWDLLRYIIPLIFHIQHFLRPQRKHNVTTITIRGTGNCSSQDQKFATGQKFKQVKICIPIDRSLDPSFYFSRYRKQ